MIDKPSKRTAMAAVPSHNKIFFVLITSITVPDTVTGPAFGERKISAMVVLVFGAAFEGAAVVPGRPTSRGGTYGLRADRVCAVGVV